MQPADEYLEGENRPRGVGEDNPLHLRQRLLARARAVADRIRERVQRALDQEADRLPPGSSENPPSFA
jgi:hypothetical protein